jgi:hypothetical protein
MDARGANIFLFLAFARCGLVSNSFHPLPIDAMKKPSDSCARRIKIGRITGLKWPWRFAGYGMAGGSLDWLARRPMVESRPLGGVMKLVNIADLKSAA